MNQTVKIEVLSHEEYMELMSSSVVTPKHKAIHTLIKCDKGTQDCDHCVVFQCCDNTNPDLEVARKRIMSKAYITEKCSGCVLSVEHKNHDGFFRCIHPEMPEETVVTADEPVPENCPLREKPLWVELAWSAKHGKGRDEFVGMKEEKK